MMIQTKSFSLAVHKKGDESTKKFALVLPGRLDTKEYPHMKRHIDLLASMGYLAVSFDPPGTWESAGDIGMYTVTNYLAAINELIEYFGNKPTLLVGHSRGGTMAMLGAIENDYVTQFIAIMSKAGPSSIATDRVKNGVITSYRDLPDNPNEQKTFLLPLSYFNDAEKYDIQKGLATCTKPKLFILGKQDTTIEPALTIASYEGSAEPKKLIEVDSGHDYRHEPELIEVVNEKIQQFLDGQMDKE